MRTSKANPRIKFSLKSVENYLATALLVTVTTGILFLIGRDTLGEGVIALLYLVPTSWVTANWGCGPGIEAAIASALAFDFFFIPPFFTFTVGSLEGWLILVIFSLVSVVIVSRIQSGLFKARKREWEAVMMLELSVSLADKPNPQAIANTLAERLQKIYFPDLVQVTIEQKHPHHVYTASLPMGKGTTRRPDRMVPILAPQGLLGEICIWKDPYSLPPIDDPLLQGFTRQVIHALQRTMPSGNNDI
jgi:K+-sensing histidine kinase KdpD